jgi:hypothetical protein
MHVNISYVDSHLHFSTWILCNLTTFLPFLQYVCIYVWMCVCMYVFYMNAMRFVCVWCRCPKIYDTYTPYPAYIYIYVHTYVYPRIYTYIHTYTHTHTHTHTHLSLLWKIDGKFRCLYYFLCVCVCMYVCMYVCMFVFSCVCMYIYMWMYVCLFRLYLYYFMYAEIALV